MSILKAACIGLQELSWHYNFKIPEKSMDLSGDCGQHFPFLGMSRNLSVIRETLELVGSFVKIDAVYLTGNAENPGCDLSGGICGSNLQGCRLSDDRRADRGLCKAQYTLQ